MPEVVVTRDSGARTGREARFERYSDALLAQSLLTRGTHARGLRYFLHSLPDAVLGPGLTDISAPNERETCPGASFKPHRAGYFGHSRPAVCLAYPHPYTTIAPGRPGYIRIYTTGRSRWRREPLRANHAPQTHLRHEGQRSAKAKAEIGG